MRPAAAPPPSTFRKLAAPLVVVALAIGSVTGPALTAPAAAASKAPADNFNGQQLQATLNTVAKHAQRLAAADGRAVTVDDIDAALDRLGHRAWEQGIDFAITDEYAADPGDVSVHITADGTVGIALGTAGGESCAMAVLPADGSRATVWSFGRALGKNCSGAVAATGPTDTAPAFLDPVPPAVVDAVTVAAGDRELNVAWAPSSDSDVVVYTVYLDGVATAQTAGTEATVVGLTNDVTYEVTVTATDEAENESAPAEPVTGTPTDLTAPPVPGNLTGTAGDGKVGLAWDASEAADLSHYNVYTSADDVVAAVVAGSTDGTVENLNNGDAYTFTVTAVDTAGNESAASNAVTLTPAGSTSVADSTWTFTEAGITLGSSSAISPRSTTVLDDGSLIVSGTMSGTATFGDTTLRSAGSGDVFVAKLRPDGQWEWAARGGGTGYEIANGADVAPDGTVRVLGSFAGTVTFGDTTLRADTAAYDVFLASVSADGQWQWATQAVGSGGDGAGDLVVDTDGNTVVSGRFQNSAQFDGTTLYSAGSTDAFVAKVSAAGQWIWAVRAGGSSTESGEGLALDAAGNVAVTGYLGVAWSSAHFGSTVLRSTGASSAYVAKLSPTGQWLWARNQTGYAAAGLGRAVTFDRDGNVVFTGVFRNNAQFGATTLKGSSDRYEAFVAKLSGAGEWMWAQQAFSSGGVSAGGLVLDRDGTITMSGTLRGYATFGQDRVYAVSGTDVFAAQLAGDGQWLDVGTFGGYGHDLGIGLSLDADGRAVVSGSFADGARFGYTVLPTGP